MIRFPFPCILLQFFSGRRVDGGPRGAEIGFLDKRVPEGVPGEGERLTLNASHLIKKAPRRGKNGVLAFLKSVILNMRLLVVCLGEWI